MHIERFLTWLRTEKRFSALTLRAYSDDIMAFSTFCLQRGNEEAGEADFTLVSSDDIRSWMLDLSDTQHLKPASVNRKLSALRSFFRWLRKEGVVTKDPFLRIGFLKMPKPLPVSLPESRMEYLVSELGAAREADDFISIRNRLIVLFFYATGIRLEELRGINIEDFSPGFRELKIRGKGDKERIIPVLVPVAHAIERYLNEIKRENICKIDKKPLFLTGQGERMGRFEVYKVVKEALGEAGVPGKRSPHVLRHTFATHLLNSGADMREIQELLGHASLQSTQVYTHNSVAQLQKAYQAAHPRVSHHKSLEP